MKSFNSILQVCLVVVLAVLLNSHIQLKWKYEELKISYETHCLKIQEQNAKNENNLKSTHTSRISGTSKGSFFMHSSSQEDISTMSDDDDTVDNTGYEDVDEPTFHKEVGEQEVSLTFSTANLLTNIDGVVYQTSNAEKKQEGMKADIVKDKVNLSHMDSTKDIYIKSSESLLVQYTQKIPKVSESPLEVKNNSSLHPIMPKIDPSLSEPIHESTHNEGETITHAFESSDASFTDQDRTLVKATTSHDERSHSDANVHSLELSSSDSTKEEGIFVFKTSLENEVIEDKEGYNYLNVQDSTSVLKTDFYHDSLDFVADSSDYKENSYEDSCEMFDCNEGGFYEDDEGVDEYTDVYESGDENKYKYKQDKEKDRLTHEYIVKLDREDLIQFTIQGTSAWCEGETQTTCRFKNLCYNTKERDFIFFKGETSVIEKSNSKHLEDDVFDINLSTIQGHNSGMFSFVTLPASAVYEFSIGTVLKRAVTISRFKPDNIMHVLHDDVVPLFQTLNHLKFPHYSDAYDVAIVFTDSYEKGNYYDFYSSLSTTHPISAWQFNNTYDLLCFPDIQLGLQTTTVWYQYGFFQPQGPVTIWKEDDVVENIRKTADYLSSHFKSECFLCSKGNYLVFLSRKDNRLILNEGELIISIMKSTRLKVMSVSLETHSLSDIITTIRLSKGVVGMHGSLLSLAIFLPPGSIVIELFPFAVNPSHYTPFKTFCDLSGSGLVYKSWANPSKTRSVSHPDRPPSEGGIRHLLKHLQDEISSQSEVPSHLCCDDPSWLYHIYQDTNVEVDIVVSLVLDAIQESRNVQELTSYLPSSNIVSSSNIPGSVKNLRCMKMEEEEETLAAKSKYLSFKVLWDRPWVFKYYKSTKDYMYELVIQEDKSKDSRRLLLFSEALSYKFQSDKVEPGLVINVWIRLLTGIGDKGQSKFTRCVV